ncbi:MAG: hypothetical protein P8X39_05965, partial [Desulfofustis sp.]
GEIPLVIIDVQRLGPSTGSATKGADSDIEFLRWGNSGGLPVIVMAPADAADCYNLTFRAFNLAEIYRCPVFIASNKEIGMTKESVPISFLQGEDRKTRRSADPASDAIFRPFQASRSSMVPPFLPIGGKRLVRQTSSSHGPDGYITNVADTLEDGIRRMRNKLTDNRDELSLYHLDEDTRADTLIITYGVTARAARDSLRHLRDTQHRVTLLVLKTLFPVPEKLLKMQICRVSRVVVVEMNLGQYIREIERFSGTHNIEFFGKMNGELISPEEIYRVVAS